MLGVPSILKGAIDFDVHASPDLVPRRASIVELAQLCKTEKMRGFMVRSHAMPTVNIARLVSELYPDMLIAGNVVLNRSVGGLNPAAATVAIKMGAHAIWMPTFDSANHISKLGSPTEQAKPGLMITDRRGEITPAVVEILGLIADSGVVLGTGEVSPTEILSLVRTSKDLGLKKVVVNHPEYWITGLSAKEQEEVIRNDAYIEHSYVFTSAAAQKRIKVAKIAKMIRGHGCKRCVLATDSGNPKIPPSPQALRLFCEELMKLGITELELARMIRENPARLLEV